MEIEWGPEIEVDGVRPDWLKDDDIAMYGQSGDWLKYPTDPVGYLWDQITHIRLPADHWYYSKPKTEPFPAWALDDPVVEKQFSQMIERHNKELDRIASEMKRLMQPRDTEGRFISRRVEKAREIALELGRDDLVARLSR